MIFFGTCRYARYFHGGARPIPAYARLFLYIFLYFIFDFTRRYARYFHGGARPMAAYVRLFLALQRPVISLCVILSEQLSRLARRFGLVPLPPPSPRPAFTPCVIYLEHFSPFRLSLPPYPPTPLPPYPRFPSLCCFLLARRVGLTLSPSLPLSVPLSPPLSLSLSLSLPLLLAPSDSLSLALTPSLLPRSWPPHPLPLSCPPHPPLRVLFPLSSRPGATLCSY